MNASFARFAARANPAFAVALLLTLVAAGSAHAIGTPEQRTRFQDVGQINRLLINVPPGTMKSLLTSVFWPAWEWSTRPSLRYLTTSYSEDYAKRDARRMRDSPAAPVPQPGSDRGRESEPRSCDDRAVQSSSGHGPVTGGIPVVVDRSIGGRDPVAPAV